MTRAPETLGRVVKLVLGSPRASYVDWKARAAALAVSASAHRAQRVGPDPLISTPSAPAV